MTNIKLTPQAAEVLGVRPQTLRCWRTKGGGPEYVRLSRNRVGYTEEALRRFVEERTHHSTAEEHGLGLKRADRRKRS